MIAIGGEPVIDYAVNLKREFGGTRNVWVVGYANDMFGYVPTPRILAGGGYEGTRSVLWSALPMPFTESVEERSRCNSKAGKKGWPRINTDDTDQELLSTKGTKDTKERIKKRQITIAFIRALRGKISFRSVSSAFICG